MYHVGNFAVAESQIRSTFFSGLTASPRMKIEKSLYLKNINPNELKVVFS